MSPSHNRPYWISVIGKGQGWTGRYHSREQALTAIRQLQKKGFRVTAFVNQDTGKPLQIPAAKRR